MSHFIVQSASAHMPSSCRGMYKRVAVLEVEDGLEHVKMISERARGVVQVVATWEKRHVGKTSKSAYHVAMTAARELAASLNAKAQRKAARKAARESAKAVQAFDPSI